MKQIRIKIRERRIKSGNPISFAKFTNCYLLLLKMEIPTKDIDIKIHYHTTLGNKWVIFIEDPTDEQEIVGKIIKRENIEIFM